MIRLSNLKLSLDYNDDVLNNIVCKKLNISCNLIKSIKLCKRSVDARKKSEIFFLASVDIEIDGADENDILSKSHCESASIVENKPYIIEKSNKKAALRPVVVGAGPAGLFCAYVLAKSGLNPIILERGQRVKDRVKTIEGFWNSGILDTQSNVQFGEGGAGTFSDGKLNTGIKDNRIYFVLQLFYECGAPQDILWQNKPHIGTDMLREVIVNLRKKIEALGGEFRFSSQMNKINIQNEKVKSIFIKTKDDEYELECDRLILAIGHSARDTFYSLYNSGIPMIAKPFAVGARIEHSQEFINQSQYGNSFATNPALPPADYKLAVHLNNGRGIYTFCMCPGGYVISAASEENMVAVNGMSNYKRNGKNANSAVLVGVDPSDFESDHPLAGIEFQRKIESAAFLAAGSGYKAPAQYLSSFLRTKSSVINRVKPTYRPGVTECDLHNILPRFICESMAQGIIMMDSKLRGFASGTSLLTAPETRSSSPVKIIRNEQFSSSIEGLYPCGEGAGYAGGITSAAVDGIKCAEMVALSI